MLKVLDENQSGASPTGSFRHVLSTFPSALASSARPYLGTKRARPRARVGSANRVSLLSFRATLHEERSTGFGARPLSCVIRGAFEVVPMGAPSVRCVDVPADPRGARCYSDGSGMSGARGAPVGERVSRHSLVRTPLVSTA